MFNNCNYELVRERSCADHHCVRGCDHGAEVAGRNHDRSYLVTVNKIRTKVINENKQSLQTHSLRIVTVGNGGRFS